MTTDTVTASEFASLTNPTYTNLVGSSTTNSIQFVDHQHTRRIMLDAIDLNAFEEDDLRALRDRINAHLPPTPPKFTTREEADQWMEEHYGD